MGAASIAVVLAALAAGPSVSADADAVGGAIEQTRGTVT
jgi:hypothetical protein